MGLGKSPGTVSSGCVGSTEDTGVGLGSVACAFRGRTIQTERVRSKVESSIVDFFILFT